MSRIPNVLRPGASNSLTTGGKHTPFFAYLWGSVINGINYFGDYTGGNARFASHVFPRDGMLCTISVCQYDGAIASLHTVSGRFNNDGQTLAGGDVPINIYDGSGNVVQDLTVSNPITTTGSVIMLASSTNAFWEINSVTSSNNEGTIISVINFEEKFGAPLFVREGHRVAIYLDNNFTNAVKAACSGYYL